MTKKQQFIDTFREFNYYINVQVSSPLEIKLSQVAYTLIYINPPIVDYKAYNRKGSSMNNKNLIKALKHVFLITLILVGITFNANEAKAADGQIKAVTIKTGKEDVAKSTYAGKMVDKAGDGYVRGSVVKVTTDCSGLLRFHYQGNNSDIVSISVYSDEALTDCIAYTSVDASSDVVKTIGLAIPKAGTYYTTIDTFEEYDIDYTIAADIYSADDDVLTSGKSKLVTLLSSTDSNLYTITLKSPGAVNVYTTYANGKDCYINVDIYQKVSGKMKVVSKGTSLASGTVAGLAKGTYYIKLSNGSDSYYSLKYKFTPITDKSGSAKSKAAALKLGTATKGLILTTDKKGKADWYKITLTKDQAVELELTGDVTDDISLSFYDSDNSLFGKLYVNEYSTVDSGAPYVSTGKGQKLPKGTYYIKVTKDGSSTSGSYSVKMKLG